MRAACIHIPNFYVQIARLKDPELAERPVIIGEGPEEKGCVVDCSEGPAKQGVFPSMPLKEAYRLCTNALFIPLRQRECGHAWEEILCALAGVSLRIETREPGTAFLDITRLPKLYKNEEQFASVAIQLVFDQFRLKAKAGVGNSRFIAYEAAFSALPDDVLAIVPGSEKKFLSPLSVEKLPVSEEARERLHLLGLHTLGQIRAFPLSAFTSQFGAAGKTMWEIAAGLEEQARIPCAFPVSDIDQEMVCDSAIYSKEQIKAALTDLLEKLCQELEDEGMACRTIKLVFDLQNRTFFDRQLVFKSPMACKEEMLRRIMNNLEQVELPSPVRIISIRASGLATYGGRQGDLFRTGSDFSRGLNDISGFLKTKYGSMPVVKVVENDVSTLLPDERFIFVEL
jgi:DNA polymerase IV